MKEDLMIKSVLLGGFDKKEVLALIERIQSEHFDESENLKKKDEEIEAVKAKIAQYEDRLESERKRFSALAALNDEYCERIYNLEEQIKEQNLKFENIQEDCDRLKKVESQIGALLVDAVLYSDKMTEKAKNAATSITSDAKQALVSTAEDVGKLSVEIAQISVDFKSDITALVEKVEILSNSLSVFSARLEMDFDAGREEPYDGQEVFDHFVSQYNKTVSDQPYEKNDESPEHDQNKSNSDENPDKSFADTQSAVEPGTTDTISETGPLVSVDVDDRHDYPMSETTQADETELTKDIGEPIQSAEAIHIESAPSNLGMDVIEENNSDIIKSTSDDNNMDELDQNKTDITEDIKSTHTTDDLNDAHSPDDTTMTEEQAVTEEPSIKEDLEITEEPSMTEVPDNVIESDPVQEDANSFLDLLESDTGTKTMQESAHNETITTGTESSENSGETTASAEEETANESPAIPEEIEAALQLQKHVEPEQGFEIEVFPDSEDEAVPETDTENSDADLVTGAAAPAKARDISESDVDELLKLFSE